MHPISLARCKGPIGVNFRSSRRSVHLFRLCVANKLRHDFAMAQHSQQKKSRRLPVSGSTTFHHLRHLHVHHVAGSREQSRCVVLYSHDQSDPKRCHSCYHSPCAVCFPSSLASAQNCRNRLHIPAVRHTAGSVVVVRVAVLAAAAAAVAVSRTSVRFCFTQGI
jgi:hypothetical protein